MILYRPVGLKELILIFESAMKAFPPRLPDQPIFYPVTNAGYAEKIAREWNASQSPFAGYVTVFDVEDIYVSQFERHIVGGRAQEELWIPAEGLDEFNSHISGNIEVDAAYFGQEFVGEIPDSFGMRGKDAVQQFICLHATADYSEMDFWCETYVQKRVVYLHYPFWRQHDFSDVGISNEKKADLLEKIEKRWKKSDIPFGLPRLGLSYSE